MGRFLLTRCHTSGAHQVERLAFNAMPGALTADMWTHVYVQQANSVFAGVSAPVSTPPQGTPDNTEKDGGLPDNRDASAACGRCGGTGLDTPLQDTPSGEDRTANYYGVSHFPCCITNFPQGWPKFAMHTIVAEADGSGVVVASLVPAFATVSAVGANVTVNSTYPFDDVIAIMVDVGASAPAASITAGVRIPGWADKATINGQSARNGTIVKLQCARGTSTGIVVHLNTRARVEKGWGALCLAFRRLMRSGDWGLLYFRCCFLFQLAAHSLRVFMFRIRNHCCCDCSEHRSTCWHCVYLTCG